MKCSRREGREGRASGQSRKRGLPGGRGRAPGEDCIDSKSTITFDDGEKTIAHLQAMLSIIVVGGRGISHVLLQSAPPPTNHPHGCLHRSSFPSRSLVLRELVLESLPRRRKLPQLVPHHILRNRYRDVRLAVVNQEAQPAVMRRRPRWSALSSLGCEDHDAFECRYRSYSPYVVRQNGARTSIRPDGSVASKGLGEVGKRYEEGTLPRRAA